MDLSHRGAFHLTVFFFRFCSIDKIIKQIQLTITKLADELVDERTPFINL